MLYSKIKKFIDLKRKINLLQNAGKELERLQLRKLKRLVHHACHTVPYYHDLFKRAGIKPDDIKTLADIRKIPITQKNDLLGLEKSQISSHGISPSELIRVRTSGTSGEPFAFLIDRQHAASRFISRLYSEIVLGATLLDRRLRIGGNFDNRGRRNNLLFCRYLILNTLVTPDEILKCCNDFKPDLIEGYISVIYSFALWLEINGIKIKHPPKFVLCLGETAHSFMKAKIADVFATEVFDSYVSMELGVTAAECKDRDGYHILEDSVIPEIVNIDGKDYFVGTNLDNYATPFIRYNTLDVLDSRLFSEGCKCGIKTKKIRSIIGRDNDFIKTSNGGLVSPMVLLDFITRNDLYFNFQKFRFIQKNYRRVTLEAVFNKKIDRKKVNEVLSDFNTICTGIELELQEVKELTKDKSGKSRIVVCRI